MPFVFYIKLNISEKMYFESVLYFVGFGIKFIENAYFTVGCY